MSAGKIGRIISGHTKEVLGKNQSLSEHRLEICRECPLCYDSAIGLLCNRYKWISKETGDVSLVPREGYVRGCGCRLDAKTRNEDDSCIIGRW